GDVGDTHPARRRRAEHPAHTADAGLRAAHLAQLVGRALEDALVEAVRRWRIAVVAARGPMLVGAARTGDANAGEVLVALPVAVVVDAVAFLDEHGARDDVGQRRLDVLL